MTVLYSRKQATLKQQEREREKRGGEEKDEEKEKLVDGEEDSRSKSFSTLLYEDKVYIYTCTSYCLENLRGFRSDSSMHVKKLYKSVKT